MSVIPLRMHRDYCIQWLMAEEQIIRLVVLELLPALPSQIFGFGYKFAGFYENVEKKIDGGWVLQHSKGMCERWDVLVKVVRLKPYKTD